MSTPADRIRALVSVGRLSPQEGDRLLATLAPRAAARPAWWILVNPFERFGGERAALAGLAVSAASFGVARLGAHFDGFLDVHVGHAPVALAASLVEQAVGWIVPSLLFWAYARASSAHVRVVDFVGVIGLARLPLVVEALVVIGVHPEVPMPGALPRLTPALLAAALASLPLLVWFVTLLFSGFKNASGLAGGKLVGGFIGIVVVSEVVAKLVLLIAH